MEVIRDLWGLDNPDDASTYLTNRAGSPICLQNFFNNEFCDHEESHNWIESFNPRSGELLAHVPSSTAGDVDRGVAAAARAFPYWSQTSRQERSDILMRIASTISDKKEMFAVWESIDQGKSLARARIEVDRAISNFRYFATYILHEEGSVRFVDGQPSTMTYEHRSPVGVFAIISPWNMPLYLLTWKIAPCIAFGCTGVAKPSEVTSITAFLLAEVFKQAELPPGVMNIVFGAGAEAGSALVKSPGVRGVTFTGGTSTGNCIRQDTVADIGKHVSLELGGKNPTLVFNDVDIEEAVRVAASAAFENSGQICLCGSRIYIHRQIFDVFESAFVEYVECNYRVRDTIGPVVSNEHYTKVRSYLQQAEEENATFLTGRVPTEKPQGGYWITPTVLSDVHPQSRIMREEIFGPVVTLCPFDTEAEAILLANDNSNGLASVLLTKDLARMRRVGERIDAGLVWVNCWLVRELGTAFGGMKSSGIGREGGAHSRDVFTNLRTIHVR
ncbi:hypothetical protein N7532_004058 [Penicillium argentinense]|uniref:Aldehyde dehydrogenase domain-containing protein n=1 Tax=Penicillium argentinense TaxID=1131581 RepID=A0A9W9KEJ4_9EURO|nr:uncharacterized protein N7532_004058 [Penicillium argentinense]KAJ5103529.1 hypothetical protein N7532_004058 [Penicillium argentinense]